MISCDEGKTAVVGMGYKVLSEWATLTYSILMEFTENNKDKEFKEHLKEKMRDALEMDFAMAFGEKTGGRNIERSNRIDERNNFKKYGIKLEDLESNGKVRKQRRIKRMVLFKQSEDSFERQKCRRIERRAVQKKGIL